MTKKIGLIEYSDMLGTSCTDALVKASADGARFHKYADPVDAFAGRVLLSEAILIARQDPALIWLEIV